MTKNILDEIIAWKRIEVEQCKQGKSIERVQVEAARMPPPRDFAAALGAPGVSLIAEIKRASPSKGAIRPDLDPVSLARCYAENGAAAISVLTDGRYFGGSLDDLRAVQQTADIPVLRKEFIVDPYQVYEARAAGADALLLIAAALDDDELAFLYDMVYDLGMSALVEVHNEAELRRAFKIGPRIIGINNRDLHTFAVDLETTARLRPLIPVDVMLVAESGIHTVADVDRLRRIGVDAMLVGEALVRAENVAEKVRQFTHHTQEYQR